MAEIHKLTKENQLFYPATISDAVVHPQIKNSITKLFSVYNVSTLFPTSGLLGTDKYNVQGAIWKLTDMLSDSEKQKGVKIGFLDESRQYEEWEFFGAGYSFSDVTGWVRVDSSVLVDILKNIYPLSATFTSDVSAILIGSMSTINFSWSVSRKGEDVTGAADKIFNSTKVSGTGKSVSETPTAYGPINYTLTVTYEGITQKLVRTVTAVHPSYYGVVTDPSWYPSTSDSVTQTLSSMVTRNGKNWTWSGMDVTDGRPCVAYPKYFGRLSSIRDDNNFEYLSSYTVYVDINIDNTPYYVYILTDPTTVTGFKQIYV